MLTPSQLTQLKNDIAADGTLNVIPNTSDGADAIATIYNQLASPAFIVWKTNVSTYEIRAALVWNEYDALTISKQNAFTFLCSNGFVNGALTNVRAGISSIFSAPGQSGNLAALTALAKRSATRAEKLFATGTGTTASPATMSFEGVLPYQDVLTARAV
jgi:hypothetical protein